MGDYRDLTIPDDSLIYCDIPYFGTTGYHTYFDHQSFYDWVRQQTNPVLISEYEGSYNPMGLPAIATRLSKRDMRGTSGRVDTTEILRLFVPTNYQVYLG